MGKNVKDVKVGDKVGVGCMVDSCLDCSNCKEVNRVRCLDCSNCKEVNREGAWTVATARR